MKSMASSLWQKMKANHAMGGLAAIITGVVVIVFLWWLLGGFWFGQLPGVAIVLAGVAEILHAVLGALTDKRSKLLHAGLLVLFLGVAGYVSFASHVMLGTLQLLSLVVLVIGAVLIAIGAISTRKA
jgi:hypothetical protein